MADDLDSLLRTFLRPARPLEAVARAVVAGRSDPHEAWEALAAHDVIPSAWVGDASARAYARAPRAPTPFSKTMSPCDDARCAHCAEARWVDDARDAPGSVLACATLASDPAGVATAEALARECAARLPTPVEVTRVVWRVGARGALLPGASLTALSEMDSLVWEHGCDAVADPLSLTAGDLHAFELNEGHARRALLAALVGRSAATARDTALAPFASLCARGYLLLGVHGRAAILGAPLLDRTTSLGDEDPAVEARAHAALRAPPSRDWVRIRSWRLRGDDDGPLLDGLGAFGAAFADAMPRPLTAEDVLDEARFLRAAPARLTRAVRARESVAFVRAWLDALGAERVLVGGLPHRTPLIERLTGWDTSCASVTLAFSATHASALLLNEDD
jgi:hypothetical protein